MQYSGCYVMKVSLSTIEEWGEGGTTTTNHIEPTKPGGPCPTERYIDRETNRMRGGGGTKLPS